MPTIDVMLADLHRLIGKPMGIRELDDALAFAKAEVESHDPASGLVRIKLEDTNQPYLWSAEGLAILLKGVLGLEAGLPAITVTASKDQVLVHSSVKAVRPHIAVFTAKGLGINDSFLKQLIQFQEKFCDLYGMKRHKVSIGLYPRHKVAFPVTYKAVAPAAVAFTPLGMTKPMTLKAILAEHPVGKEFNHTLSKANAYPVLVDAASKVLSFIPIINSADLGRLEIGDTHLMFECTGTDQASVELCANIFAHLLWMRGFTIHSATVKDGGRSMTHPNLSTETQILDVPRVNAVLGTRFTAKDIKACLERARHQAVILGSAKVKVTIPSYRKDVMHSIDLVEDVAIMADYNTLPTHPLTSYTIGDVKPIERTIDTVRSTLCGFGMQEVLSPVLSNIELLHTRMRCPDPGTVQIKESMTQTYSCLRTWIVPILLEALSKNLHRTYPQHLFETGEVCLRTNKQAQDQEHCGAVLCNPESDYTRVRQALDALLTMMGFSAITYEPLDETHPFFGGFIPGRAALCRIKGSPVAILGEIHPEILDQLSIRMPVAAMELNISALHELR